MTIQEQAIQEFEGEIAALYDDQKRLLKEQMSPGIKFSLASTKKNIEHCADIVSRIPFLTDEVTLSLLLEELGLTAEDLDYTQEKNNK